MFKLFRVRSLVSGKTGTVSLIPAVLCFTAGIGLAGTISTKSSCLLLLLVILTFLFISCQYLNRTSFLLLPFFFLVGIVHHNNYFNPQPDPELIHHQIKERREVTLIGILRESPIIDAKKTGLTMTVDTLVTPESTTTAKGKVLLRFFGRPPEDLWPGDRFMARCILSRPRNYGIEGGFDYRNYLAAQNIYLTGWLRSRASLLKLHSPLQPSLIQRIQYGPEQIRYRVNRFIDATVDYPFNGLYKAILTGDRSGIPPDILENFKKTGCIHLLAISGLHMGLLAIVVCGSVHWLLKRSTWLLLHAPAWKISVLIALAPLILYALIAGFNTPVVRALIMTSVFFAAVLLDRQWHVPTNIAIAALIILIINPATLFTVSFQLSFAAVTGIALALPLLQQRFFSSEYKRSLTGKIKSWLSGGLLVSLAASCATTPLLLYYFNRFSPISPLSTLIIEPLLCFWSLLTGLAGACMIFVSPDIASLFFQAGTLGISGAVILTRLMAEFPLCCIWFSTPYPFEILCMYLLFAGLLYWKQSAIAKSTALIALFFLLVIPPAIKTAQKLSRQTTVSFLDVGQGNATVIQFPGGKVALLDGGGSSSQKFNVGVALIGPWLWRQRIKRIDDVVISHPDSDHYNGLPFILARFKPERLWINGRPGDQLYSSLLHQAEQQGIQINIPKPGQVVYQDKIVVLKNTAALHLRSPNISSDNDNSLILKLTTPQLSFLFPGDVEKNGEKTLGEENDINANILLAPHHGSKTSSSHHFLKTVQADEIVISASPYKQKNFPAADVLRRYREHGAIVFNTATDGTISYRIKGTAFTRRTFR